MLDPIIHNDPGDETISENDEGIKLSVFVIQYYGDLPITRRVEGCDTPDAFNTLDEALAHLVKLFGPIIEDEMNPEDAVDRYPDPEDDRIVIFEIDPDDRQSVKVVWHFSGWHWTHDAEDLPGGPIDQGSLPGTSDTLYALAMRE